MTSMLTEVWVVESRHWPEVMHSSLIVLHALTNESLCLNALDRIQCLQTPQPTNRTKAPKWCGFKKCSTSHNLECSSVRCACTWSVSDLVFCNSKCNTLMPSSWNTCSARAKPPTWLFSVNIMDVLSGDILSCRFNLSFDADDVYSQLTRGIKWIFSASHWSFESVVEMPHKDTFCPRMTFMTKH